MKEEAKSPPKPFEKESIVKAYIEGEYSPPWAKTREKTPAWEFWIEPQEFKADESITSESIR